MKYSTLCLLVGFYSLPSFAQESEGTILSQLATEEKIEEARVTIIDRLEEEANRQLRKAAPFLSLNYLGNDDDSESDGWGLDYDWSKSVAKSKVPNADLSGLSPGDKKRFKFTQQALSAELKGSYAHEDISNVNNLSSAGIGINLNVVDSGWLMRMESPRKAEECMNALERDDFDSDPAFDAATDACFAPYFDIVRNMESPTFSYSFNLNYKIEANADYTEHHKVYGVSSGLAFEPSSGSALQMLNIFDYPFRFFTRPFFANAENHNANLPSVYFALENVDPSKDSLRNSLPGGDGRFDRLNFEISFSTLVATAKNYPITFEADYRLFREISPSSVIKAAELDRFEYSSFAIYLPSGVFNIESKSDFFLRYMHGKLPFDSQTNEAISIGWKSNLQDLVKNLF